LQEQQIISQIITRYRDVPGGLLPLLHGLQDELGFIPADAVPEIAAAFNLSRAEVHGVISFYHDFRTERGGIHTVQICRAEACQAVGSRALEEHAIASLGVGFGETTADGQITLEPVYCLGNCACSPSIRINDDVHARVDTARLDVLLTQLRADGGSQ
jgi:formate dehydrogenase subunit gamma